MSKIAIIGDQDSIWAFKAFGFSLYYLRNIGEAEESLAKALTEDYSIIFVTEEVFKACREQIAELQNRPIPAITILPNLKGSQGIGKEEIRKAARKAIGADIV